MSGLVEGLFLACKSPPHVRFNVACAWQGVYVYTLAISYIFYKCVHACVSPCGTWCPQARIYIICFIALVPSGVF